MTALNVRYALAYRDMTNTPGPISNDRSSWLCHDKLKHIGHSKPNYKAQDLC